MLKVNGKHKSQCEFGVAFIKRVANLLLPQMIADIFLVMRVLVLSHHNVFVSFERIHHESIFFRSRY